MSNRNMVSYISNLLLAFGFLIYQVIYWMKAEIGEWKYVIVVLAFFLGAITFLWSLVCVIWAGSGSFHNFTSSFTDLKGVSNFLIAALYAGTLAIMFDMIGEPWFMGLLVWGLPGFIISWNTSSNFFDEIEKLKK